MNVLGIDIQSAFTRLVVREGNHVSRVGDGTRLAIPTIIAGEQWGSVAYRSNPEGWLLNDVTAFLSVNDAFWQHLTNRYYDYLGHVEPTVSNGYCTVVTSMVPDETVFQNQIQQLGLQAGMPQIDIIPATNALMARWLNEKDSRHDEFRRMAAVVIGDRHSLMTIFEKEASQSGTWQPVHQKFFTGQGSERFYWGFIQQWQRSVHYTDSIEKGLSFFEAIDDFLIRLKHQLDELPVQWTGASRAHMKRKGTIFSLTRAELGKSDYFQAVIQPIVNELKTPAAGALDGVLISGTGGRWIMDVRPFNHLGTVWQSEQPDWDLPIGASFWPDFKNMVGIMKVVPDPTALNEDAFAMLRKRFSH